MVRYAETLAFLGPYTRITEFDVVTDLLSPEWQTLQFLKHSTEGNEMRKARKAVVASLLKAADAKGAVPFVITSAVLDESEIKKTELANYGCNHCGTVIASNKGIAPFCQTCGSDEVNEWDNDALSPEGVADDEELANVTCAKCGTHNVMSLQTASTFGGVVHCSACGHQVAYDVTDTESDDDIYLLDGDDDEVVDMTEQEDIPVAIPVDDMPIEVEEEVEAPIGEIAPLAADVPSEDFMAVDNPETSESDPNTEATTMPPELENEEVPDSGIEADIEEVQADGEEGEIASDDAPADSDAEGNSDAPVEGADDDTDAADTDDSDEDDGEEEDSNADEADEDSDETEGEGEDEADDYVYDEEAKIVTAALINTVSGDIALAYMGDSLIAARGGIPVAKLEKASAGDYQSVFHARSFAQAIRHQIAQLGPKKALSSFGFELVRVAVPMKKVAVAHIEKRSAKKAQEIASSQESYVSDLSQCLGLAAVAMTKGINKKRPNVLKAALVRELASLNVREGAASALVNRVFAGHADTYHRELFSYAGELMGKSVDVRNQLAELVEDTDSSAIAPQFDTDGVVGDDDVADAPVEARLQTAGVIPASRLRRGNKQIASADDSSVVQLANAVRGQNGGRLF